MSRLTVGEALAARLFAAETAVDQALIEVATFAAALPAARTDAWLSAVTGQRAFDGAAAALTHLTEARAQLVATHRALAALAHRLGLDALAVGPVDKPGDDTPVGGGGGDGAGVTDNMVNKTLPRTTESC
jgi:hypothetical protein